MDTLKRVYDTLNRIGIAVEIVEHPPALTTEEANRYIEGIAGVRTKTLFLTNKKKRRFFLVIMDDADRLNMEKFAERVLESRIKMASEDVLFEKLALTPGAVSPFGLLNNKDHDVSVYIAEKIISQKRMSFHPNRNDQTLFIETTDLLRFFEALEYPVTICDI